MKYLVQALVLFCVCVVGPAFAADILFQYEYDEPVTNADGTVLDDLAKVEISIDVVSDGVYEVYMERTASQPSGGTHMTGVYEYTLPDGVELADLSSVKYRVRAYDLSGNVSPWAEVNVDLSFPVVDTIAPSSPNGLSITVQCSNCSPDPVP